MNPNGQVQAAEFPDGLRIAAQPQSQISMTVQRQEGIDPASLPCGTQSLNNFAWVVNANNANGNNLNATMEVPC